MRHSRVILVAILLVNLIQASSVGAASEAPASPSPGAPIAGRFDIGGRSLALACQGTGTPTVILEAGANMGASTWEGLMPDLATLGGVCAYDRANTGASDGVETPRSLSEAVTDLRALLVSAGVTPPYVLVGHSFGGLLVRLYAAIHPDEVAGIVLVDGTPIDIIDPELACSGLSEAACSAVRSQIDQNPEGVVPSDEEIVLMAESIPAVPARILVATDHSFPPAIDVELEAQASRLQEALADEWPTAELVLAEGSGHFIQYDRPAVVVQAITDVLEAAREAGPMTEG